MKNVRITIIPPTDEYGCASCSENSKDVNAEVEVNYTVGVLDWPATTWMCANHAECITVETDERRKTQ